MYIGLPVVIAVILSWILAGVIGYHMRGWDNISERDPDQYYSNIANRINGHGKS